jgi:hypothetical protein
MMFRDIHLKFAVLSCLNEKGLYIDEATQIKMGLYRKRAFVQLGYDEIVPEVYEYFEQLKIDESKLELITEFNPSASNACYNLLVKEWSGEDDIFDIRTLDGIESLKNMSVFNPMGLMETEIDISALLRCKNLKIVYRNFLPDSESVHSVIEKLKMKGLQIRDSG